MVSPQKIKYNNIFSDEGLGTLDVILDVAFDSDNGATSSYLNRSAVASESHDGRYKNTTRYKFDELFSPQFTIVKKDFSDFAQDEVRKVLKYLTSTDKPALLEVYYDGASNAVDWACIGGFTSIETYKLANSRIVGIVAKFEAITPYAMSRLYGRDDDGNPIVYNITENNQITIDIETDDNKPVYPKITIQQKGAVVKLPDTTTPFNSIVDMSDYVENTVYQIGSTYYYKTYTPTFTVSDNKPDYVDWHTVEVDRSYTSADTFDANTFYHYDYAGKYYWKIGSKFYEEPSRPVYGDWKTKTGTKVYTANDTFEEKTIYIYNGKYYWMAPHNFYKSSKPPNLQTTSVKIVSQHYDFWGQPDDYRTEMIVKNNNLTEKIIVDCANKVISSDSKRVFGSNFDWNLLTLYDGTNILTIEGNCDVSIEYREARKVGEY